MKIFLVLAFVLAMSSGSAAAQTFEESRVAYNRGDYATVLPGLRRAAEQGNAIAQHNLGVMYDKGKGVAEDAAEAAKWYLLAAEQGYAGSQFQLGLMYALGRGVPRNYLQAHVWASLAASRVVSEEPLVHEALARLRDWLAKQLSKSELGRAQRIAEEWRAVHGHDNRWKHLGNSIKIR